MTAAWPKVALRDIGTWYGGGTPSKSRPEFWENGEIPWLSPKDMSADVLSETQDHITQTAVEESAVRLVPADSVALVVRSGILERTLPVARVPFVTTLNQDMKAILAREGVDPRWIAYGIRAFEHQLLSTTRKAGTTVASIETSKLQSFELPVPSLDEQRHLIEILEDHLSRLDAAAEYTRTASSRLFRMAQAARQQAIDSPSSPMVPLSQLIQRIETGKSLGGTAPATEDEWGIIKVSAMTWGAFRPDENKRIPDAQANPAYEIREGDLLVSRANTSAYVGASVLVGQVRPRLLLSDKSLRLVPRTGVDPAWLNEVLQAPRTRQQISALATGTKDSMRNISQKALLSVLVPDTPAEQQSEVLAAARGAGDSVESLASAVDRTNRRSDALRRAILAAAFSGGLTGSVSDWEAA